MRLDIVCSTRSPVVHIYVQYHGRNACLPPKNKVNVIIFSFVITSLFKNPLHNKGKIHFQAQPLALFMDITKEHRSHPIQGVNKLIFNHGITVSHNKSFLCVPLAKLLTYCETIDI